MNSLSIHPWRWIILSSVLLTGYLAIPAQANEIPQDGPQANSATTLETIANLELDQSIDAATIDVGTIDAVTSVSQLSDVKPTDWAFQALQSLVERYGCIAGYPDQTFRGNRAITRYEFAAGLNSCMDRINDLISSATDPVKKEDLESLRKLQEQFAAELSTLRGRVDNLETRTAILEKQQFSTTTKLNGQVILGLQGRSRNNAAFFPTNGPATTPDPGTNLTLGYSSNLSLTTAFSPTSLLLVGLQAGNLSTAPSLNNDVRLSYESNTGNNLFVSDLTYRQLLGRNIAVIVGAEGLNAINVFRGSNRVESAGSGPISALAQRNPIIGVGAGRAGAGFDWQIMPRISLQGVYSAGDANNPNPGSGLFNGPQSTGAQLTFAPTKSIDLALQYVNAYSPTGDLGTGIGDSQVVVNSPINTNAVGLSASWRMSSRVTLGGWTGLTRSTIPGASGGVDTFNWMTYVNLPDFGVRGNLAGLYVGQPPRITSSDLPSGQNLPDLLRGGLGAPGGQEKATTHIEAFYRMRVSDNISVTPGVMVILNPANSNSDTITVGAIRTTFTF